MADRTATRTVEPPATGGASGARIASRRVERGTTLGRYEIVAPIGSGGMADVWLGRATGHGGFARLLAIKTARFDLALDPRLRAMFLREGEVAAGIRHANVVDVLDVGESDGVLYQVMSLVEGDSLAGLARQAQTESGAPLPLGVTLSIVVDALHGLHAAHECTNSRGVPRHLVHRDVSPQNILVGLDGLARMSDFGIASVLSDDGETTGTLRGKLAYFAPEQAGREKVDRRTDVFAMGIVLWEALSGVRLFKGRDAVETLDLVRSAPVADPRDHAKDVPAAIAAVVMRALERDPSARYGSAEAMADELTAAARSAGVVTERRDVARTVERLAGDRVRATLHRANANGATIADATAHATAIATATRTTAIAPNAPPPTLTRPTTRRWRLAAVTIVAALGAVTAAAMTLHHSRSLAAAASVSATDPGSPSPSAVTLAPAAPSPSPSPSPSSSPPAESPPAEDPLPREAARARHRTPGPPTTTPSLASPARRPPFEHNPFAAPTVAPSPPASTRSP